LQLPAEETRVELLRARWIVRLQLHVDEWICHHHLLEPSVRGVRGRVHPEPVSGVSLVSPARVAAYIFQSWYQVESAPIPSRETFTSITYGLFSRVVRSMPRLSAGSSSFKVFTVSPSPRCRTTGRSRPTPILAPIAAPTPNPSEPPPLRVQPIASWPKDSKEVRAVELSCTIMVFFGSSWARCVSSTLGCTITSCSCS